MNEYINEFINVIIYYIKLMGPLAGMFLIVIESIFPILPLGIFIGMNQAVYGPVLGFLLSWIATIIGCYLSFIICRTGFSNLFYKRIRNRPKMNKMINRLTKTKFSTLVLLMSLPFLPAFMFNVAGGLSKITKKKFMGAVVISKISIVYFWGYIGNSLLQSLKEPTKLIEVAMLLVSLYLISLIVGKKFNIK